MEFNIKTGLKKTLNREVKFEDTAKNYGSGLVEVYATPAMIAFMEQTSLECVNNEIPEGYNTVGTSVNIKHIKATPVGMKVRCEAELIESDNKKLKFNVHAYDEEGKIGMGTHSRYIINNKDFINSLK